MHPTRLQSRNWNCETPAVQESSIQELSNNGSSPVVVKNVRCRLQQRYDDMWSASVGKLRTGKVEIDEILAAGSPDRRRGLTLIARPLASVRERVATFLRELRRMEPDQHYYATTEFHITVLSLFTSTTDHDRFFAQRERYVSALGEALRTAGPFRIEFAGVTASAGAILIQGFPGNEALNTIRDTIRQQLRIHGLTEGLDVRYRLETAHMTVARFRTRLHNGAQFASFLEQSRQRSFGTTDIRSLSLVRNDWYMTHRILKTLKRYRLSPRGSSHMTRS